MQSNKKKNTYFCCIASAALMAMASANLAFAGGTVGVAIPNTFAAGTTISSSAMNSNFTAVAAQMPAVKETGISDAFNLTSTGYSNVASLTITAPTSGNIVVRFDGNAYVPVAGDTLYLAASNVSQSTGSIGAGDAAVQITPATATALTLPFSHTRVYPVTAGSHTYYATAFASVTGSYSIFGTLTVEFFPNGL